MITNGKQRKAMKNPPHSGLVVLQECIEPSGWSVFLDHLG
jgi:hypothetical protein